MPDRPPKITLRGFDIYPGFLDVAAQRSLLDDLREVIRAAPLIRHKTPRGKPMSVAMTAAGRLGWVATPRGYGYAERHPSGVPWPEIPASLAALWDQVTDTPRRPESCLINFYGQNARMGMHQDRDEADFSQPVVSVSLGDDGLFRIGNQTRGGKTDGLWLASGAVVVMGGAARLTYHGVDRIRWGSSRLLPEGGRINVTMRVVT